MPRPSRSICRWIAACALAISPRETSLAFAAGPPGDSATPECPKARQSALSEIACEITRSLVPTRAHFLVVAERPLSDRPLSDDRGLAFLVTRLVSARLGATAEAARELGDLAHARLLARKHDVLIYLTLKIENGKLGVTADAYEGHSSFWDRLRFGEPRATSHSFSSRRIDAEIASFLKPIPLVTSAIEKSAGPGKAVALACGDADGDGSLELLVVGRQRLWSGRLAHYRFVIEHDVAWSALSPVAPVPLRQPIATATIRTGEFIEVGISDRSAAERISADLRDASRLSGAVPWEGVGCLVVVDTALGAPKPCAQNESSPLLSAAPKRAIDAVASARITTAAGDTHYAFAWRASDDVVTVMDDTRRVARIADAGAQIAVGDLDLDGLPEIVTTRNTLDPAVDAIVVHTWTAANTLEERFRIAMPQGVSALTICPPEASGPAFIAAATGNEIWILK